VSQLFGSCNRVREVRSDAFINFPDKLIYCMIMQTISRAEVVETLRASFINRKFEAKLKKSVKYISPVFVV